MEEEILAYPDNIEIDGDRADEDQFWRIQRIHRVLGYAQALADLDNNEDFYKKIKSLYDYKGSITAIWVYEPSLKEKEYLQKAWESIVTNYEGNPIEHELES
ncbi:MAG: hypothetical protein GXO79_00090 [Chlorobi bacterium]|nr:hypothetical protein [Chlorobiota bacterium]